MLMRDTPFIDGVDFELGFDIDRPGEGGQSLYWMCGC